MSLTSLLVFCTFTSLFIGAFWRPMFGVLGYLAVYVVYNPQMWWGLPIAQKFPRPSYMAVLFLIVASLLHIKELNWSFSRKEIEFYLFLGLIWLVSLIFAVGVQEDNWQYLIKMVKLFVFVFMFIRIVASLDNYRLVVWTFIFGALFLAYQAHTLSPSHFSSGRLDTLGGIDFREANGFASFLAMTTTFLGIQALRAPLWKKVVCVFGIALMINAIIMTQSRAVFLGLLVATPYALIRAPSKKRKQLYLSVILGIVLFFTLADSKFLARMQTIQTTIRSNDLYTDHETMSRLDFWKASLQMLKDHPLGIGIKNFEKVVPYYDPRNPGMDAHNTYVLCYSEIGIMGIVVFLIIVAETILQMRRIHYMAMRTPHNEEISLHSFGLSIILIIYFLGYMVTHSILYSEILWILLAMPICLENATQKLSGKSYMKATGKSSKGGKPDA